MISMMGRHHFYDGIDGFGGESVIKIMTSLIYHLQGRKRSATAGHPNRPSRWRKLYQNQDFPHNSRETGKLAS